MTNYPSRYRPADSRCGHPSPDLLDVPETSISPDHKLGYYLSTYCEHGLGDGRDEPSQCRANCKACHAPCACLCHGGRIEPFEGFSVEQEDVLREAVRQVVRRLGVAPRGPRGEELLTDIVTGALHALDRDGQV